MRLLGNGPSQASDLGGGVFLYCHKRDLFTILRALLFNDFLGLFMNVQRRSLLKAFSAAVLSCVFSASVLAADASKTLYFSAIPDQDETALKARFDKVGTYLTEALGVPVKYIPVKSYAASVTSFRNNQIQLSWFGGLSGVRARLLTPGAQAIAQGVEDPEFYSYLIAHESTGLRQGDGFPADVAGKTFTFGSKDSTSGRLMPEFYIREYLQQAPSQVFKTVGFSGNHSRTVALVESGAYQVGAVNFKVWDKMVAAGKVDTSKVQVVWKTPAYPDYQWSIRGDVDKTWGEGFGAKVQQALLAMDDPQLLESFPRKGFVKASNDDYLTIENTAKAIGLLDD